jgi:pyroglutamyl-peptidase
MNETETVFKSNQSSSREKVLVLTGFGPFVGVDRNPTQEIIEELSASLPSLEQSDSKVSIFYHVFEVSVGACEEDLIRILSDFRNYEIIFLHLGVDARSDAIKFEEFAYNNMSFRVPDARQYEPMGLPIHSSLNYDLGLRTAWNIPLLVERCRFLTQQEDTSISLPIRPSTDPGRFLCNYIFFRTMLLQHPQQLSTKSLFVHVPYFTVVSKEQQIAVVKTLATLLVFQSEEFDLSFHKK